MRRFFAFDSIRRQIEQNATQFVVTLSLATMPIAIISAWLVASAWQSSSIRSERESAELSIQSTMEDASIAITRQFNLYNGLSQVFASWPGVIEQLSGQESNEQLITDSLAGGALGLGLDLVLISDAKGEIILASNRNTPSDLTGQNLGGHGHLSSALQGESSFEFRFGPPNKQPGYYFSTPIFADSGDVIGATTIKVNQQTLADAVQQSNVILADERGVVVLSDQPETIFRALTNSAALLLPPPILLELYDRDTIEVIQATPTNETGEFGGRRFDVVDRFGQVVPHLVLVQWLEINNNRVYLSAYKPIDVYARMQREQPVAAATLVLVVVALWWALTASTVYTLRARWYRAELQASNHQLELANQELSDIALNDPLTGCGNRRGLNQRLEEEMDRAIRYGRPLSVAIVDIDHFKNLNDKFGHQAGDQALKHLVALIQPRLRNTDFLARAGGEEFVILMPETVKEAAEFVLERIREVIASESFFSDRGTLNMTISVGIACIQAGETGTELIERADVQLYRAKSEGRNRVCS